MKTNETRKPITVRLRPSIIKAARIAAVKAGQRFGEWLDTAIAKAAK